MLGVPELAAHARADGRDAKEIMIPKVSITGLGDYEADAYGGEITSSTMAPASSTRRKPPYHMARPEDIGQYSRLLLSSKKSKSPMVSMPSSSM